MTIFSRPQKSAEVTVESLADEFIAEAGEATSAAIIFKNTAPEDLGKYHHSLGRDLRNHFGLWNPVHPLTQHWHLNPECRNMVDGVDYSEDHPDAVSMDILRAIHSKLQSL